MSRSNPWRLLLGLWLLALATVAGAQDFPELTGRVVDAAEIYPDGDEPALVAKLESVEQETGRQFVIVTVPDLQGYDIADYGYQLGREWGIGDAERNDGVLLIVAPSERKVRIEVGYGLEGELTDAWSDYIIQSAIIPEFKAGDLPGGIDAGADGIIARIAPPEGMALAASPPVKEDDDIGTLAFIVVMFVLVFVMPFAIFVIPLMIFAKLYPKRYKKWKADAAKSRARAMRVRAGGSSRSFSSGRSFSSSSSFSGGGGSFGGGGSSGSW